MKKKILFLGHEASLSGAPKLLLSLIKYVKQQGNAEVMIFLKKGGALLNEFAELGEVQLLSWPNKSLSKSEQLVIRLLPAYRMRNWSLKERLRKFNPDLIVNYTMVNAPLFPYLEGINAPMLTVAQEMKFVIELFDRLGMSKVSKVLARTNAYIACSGATKRDLVNHYDVDPELVQVVYNSVAYHQLQPENERNAWRAALGIPEDAWVVGACAGPIWRKGSDLFLSAARHLKKMQPQKAVYFVWQGGAAHSADFIRFENEVRLSELEATVRAIPSVKNVQPFFQGIDVFACTFSTSSAKAALSPYGTNTPRPSASISSGPPDFSKAMTGLPCKPASSTTIPKGSSREVQANTS
ncbi:MAG: glycosyltransferase family 4 protein, partial [Bacteroidota bacterium]